MSANEPFSRERIDRERLQELEHFRNQMVMKHGEPGRGISTLNGDQDSVAGRTFVDWSEKISQFSSLRERSVRSDVLTNTYSISAIGSKTQISYSLHCFAYFNFSDTRQKYSPLLLSFQSHFVPTSTSPQCKIRIM